MYRKILIATDGSELSEQAIDHGIALAKTVGSEVLGVTITAPMTSYMTSEAAAMIDPDIFEERTARAAKRYLDVIAEKAAAENVSCSTMRVEEDPVYEGIIGTAEQQQCDLIVMASHGRSGISGFLLGSETNKVLAHSKVPVLVCR